MTVHPSHPAPSVEGTDLRSVFRRAVSSVWVITCAGERGPVGMTALSVASVSMDPPLVSFNLGRTSASLAEIARSGRVALHLLAGHQREHVARFAGDRARRFADDGSWGLDAHGIPALHGVAARLVATVRDLHPAGDSYLAVAEVTATQHGRDHDPSRALAHHAGVVHHLTARA